MEVFLEVWTFPCEKLSLKAMCVYLVFYDSLPRHPRQLLPFKISIWI